MLRKLLVGTVLMTAACGSETWVYAPTAELSVVVEEGEMVLEGEAVLTYDPAAIPDDEVSNALRLSVASSRREVPLLDFPEARPRDVHAVDGDGSLNLLRVYRACDAARCEVVVPFTITRERGSAAVLEVTGDAILTKASVAHVTQAQSDAATLQIVVY